MRYPLETPAVTMLALQRKELPGLPGIETGVDTRFSSSSGRRLLCRVCEEPITADGFRISVAGSHLHTRTNPVGLSFEFGCFQEAPGVVTHGTPTSQYTWFPGHAWAFAACRGCGEQLGWAFYGAEPAQFFGLICETLVPEEEAPSPM